MLRLVLLFWLYFQAACNALHENARVLEADASDVDLIDKFENVNGKSWDYTKKKLTQHLSKFISIPKTKRNLVLYHVGMLDTEDSLDIGINNLKLFISSIMMSGDDAEQHATYIFNIVGGLSNPLMQYIPGSLPGSFALEWFGNPSDMETFLKTALLLDKKILDIFTGVFLFSHETRGPFTLRSNGQWMQAYRTLLDANNVGLVGSTLSCEVVPHIQKHALLVQSKILYDVAYTLILSKDAHLYTHHEIDFNKIISSKYNITSLMTSRRNNEKYFQGNCPPGTGLAANPSSWCNVSPHDLIFMKWGGEPMRTHGYICDALLLIIRRSLAQIAYTESTLDLILPEVNMGGTLYPLYKEYSHELFRDEMINGGPKGSDIITSSYSKHYASQLKTLAERIVQQIIQENNENNVNSNSNFNKDNNNNSKRTISPLLISHPKIATTTSTISNTKTSNKNNKKKQQLQLQEEEQQEGENVCILTRSASVHDKRETSNSNSNATAGLYHHTGTHDYIRSLLRQTNPNWIAIFFLTDRKPFEKRLYRTLKHYNDSRLVYLQVPEKYLPEYTSINAGYMPTDYILKKVLQEKYNECKYISISNADNVYGSDIIHRILNYKAYVDTSITLSTSSTTGKERKNKKKISNNDEVAMILTPLDSRNLVERDWFLQRQMNKETSLDNVYQITGLETIRSLENYVKTLRKSATPKHTIHMGWDSYVRELLTIKKNNTFITLNPLKPGYDIPQLYKTINMTFQGSWTFRCINVQYQYLFNKFGYAKQSVPVLGSVDLASVFMSTKKLKQLNVYFENFTNLPCVGCQDGYFTEYLVKNMSWNYVQLPMDELNSLIFHGPSPTWCIASGNVWLDHPLVNYVGCLTHKTVSILLEAESKLQPDQRIIDWDHYLTKNQLPSQMCLRLSQNYYQKISKGLK